MLYIHRIRCTRRKGFAATSWPIPFYRHTANDAVTTGRYYDVTYIGADAIMKNRSHFCEVKILKNILKINENATLVFSISFQHELFNKNFVFIRQLYFTYSTKRLFFVWIDCQYVQFNSISSKTSNMTPYNVTHT